MGINEIPTGGGWRFKAGLALLALMALAWLLIPIEAALGMSVGTMAATTAGIVTANKGILLLAIVVMGKPGPGVEGQAFAQPHPGDRRQSDALPDRSRDVLLAIPARLIRNLD
jgi:hypothetical protein